MNQLIRLPMQFYFFRLAQFRPTLSGLRLSGTALSFSLFLTPIAFGSISALEAIAAPPHSTVQPGIPPIKQLMNLENRYFGHLYQQDPIEKRLERLELLIFGATQGGTNDERLAQIRKVVTDRDSQSKQNLSKLSPTDNEVRPDSANKSAANKSVAAPAENGSAKSKGSSVKYPVLDTLEWRVLKKTYSAESLDQRLDRMETKIFGAPSSTMAYADRVERLKRTTGIAESPIGQPIGHIGTGPRPKAHPRGNTETFGEDGGNEDFNNGLGSNGLSNIPANPFGANAFGANPFGMNMPFGDPGNPAFGRMSSMFSQMQRQMNEMRTLPSGAWTLDSSTGEWVNMQTGKRIKGSQFGTAQPGQGAQVRPGQAKPGMRPYSPNLSRPGLKITPQPEFSQPPSFNKPLIPPYSDPNSI